MTLSKPKQLFLLVSCAFLVGFSLIVNSIDTVELKNRIAEGEQLVTPVAHVALLRSGRANASSITDEEIKAMVRQAVETAGGLASVVADGDSVILKPNLVGAGGATPFVNGVTTDYRVVRAVSELVRELNPTGWIGIVEGSAPGNGQGTKDMFNLYGYKKTNLPAVDDILALEDIDGADKDYASAQLVAVSLPDSISLYPDSKKPNNSRPIYLAKLYAQADAVISIPVLKNHESAALTVGIKNTSIGMTPPSIYRKDLYNIPNLRFEIDHSYPDMHKWIHDFFMCRPIDFVIVDGLQGLQHGPGGGSNPSQNRMNMRLILAGRDPVAVDAISAHIIGMDPSKINYLAYLHNHGAGCADHKLIRVHGNVRVSDVKKKYRHNDARTIAVQVSDFTPPALAITAVEVQGQTLALSLATASKTKLVEIAVDGQLLPQAVVSGFDDIRIPLPQPAAVHQIEVIAYDAYRNSSSAAAVTRVVDGQDKVAATFQLLPNYPNPFNPTTTISFNLPTDDRVTLTVYNSLGVPVRTLLSGALSVGTHALQWNGRDDAGNPLPSGVYYAEIVANSGRMRNKMVMVR